MRLEGSLLAAVDALHGALRARGERVAVAESCTGGLVGGAITAVEGASDVFGHGIVTYSNRAKVDLLGVSPATIDRTGAVSGPTARAMAAGVRDRLDDTTWGLSVTGLAGPGGGRPGKPVGTVYIGIATRIGDRSESSARRFRFDGDRHAVRLQTTRAAIRLAADAVDQSD